MSGDDRDDVELLKMSGEDNYTSSGEEDQTVFKEIKTNLTTNNENGSGYVQVTHSLEEDGEGEVESPLIHARTKKRRGRFFAKCFLFISMFAVFCYFAVVLVIVPTMHSMEDDTELDEARLMTLKSYSELSESVLLDMDLTVNPCDDFYQYSCGGWLNRIELKETEYRTMRSFDTVTARNERIIMDKIKQEWPILTAFYKSCYNVDTELVTASDNVNLVKGIINDINSANNVSELLDLSLEVIETIGIDFNPLFEIYADIDSFEPDEFITTIWQRGYLLPDASYYNSDNGYIDLEEYYEWILSMFDAIGEIKTSHDIEAIINLETYFANMSMGIDQMRDPYVIYNPIPKEQLELTIGKILSDFMNCHDLSRSWTNVAQLGFFYKLGLALDNNTIELEHMKNLFTYNLLVATYPVMSQKYRSVYHVYREMIYGSKPNTNRTEVCLSSTGSMLPLLSGHYYVDKAFSDQAKKDAEVLVQEIEESMDNILMQGTWMDVNTIVKAREKLEKMINQIGYPDSWVDESILFGMYDVYMDETDYFKNYFAIRRVYYLENINAVDTTPDPTQWERSPAEVNAYYTPSFNRITFPAGILQPPFFSSSYPKSVNYGGMGVVVGHEITHGFDDQGSMYDADGVLKDWWSDTSLSHFEQKTSCVVDRYSTYEVSYGIYLDGGLTLGENVADMGGVREAYDALQRYKAELDKELVEESDVTEIFGMSQDELFFVSFAQTWCEKTTNEYDILMARTNPHSPGKYRVFGTLSNYEKFSEVFDCPVNSKYNPISKCRVW